MLRDRIEGRAVTGNEPMTQAVDAMLGELRTWHGALAPLRAAAST